MPTVQDEEESLCLLAADLQEANGPAKDSPNRTNTNWTTNDDEDDDEDEEDHDQLEQWTSEKSAFLAAGIAEKAFYNVCKTTEEELAEEEEEDDSLEVMNDIIGTLEADHLAAASTKCSATEDNESRNSRSLVVDIHLPPASEASEDEAVSSSSAANVVSGGNALTVSRPCKHELNRFQRCYSDGSQGSPKRKAKAKQQDQHRHSHFGGDQSQAAPVASGDAQFMREENLDRIETVICDNDQTGSRTGAKAKSRMAGSNFRGSTVSEGSSGGLLRGAAFGLHQELMQFKNSLLEGTTKTNNSSESKQKRKSDSEMYVTDSPSPLVKFEVNDHDNDDDILDEADFNNILDDVKVEIKKHKFIYPKLNFFGSGSSSTNVVGDSAMAPQLKFSSDDSKNDGKKSPFTFFTMDSDDDFDPYASDVPSDMDTKKELLKGHGLENQNIDIDRGSCCLSASSSTVSMPVCRICQLPGIEPSNPLISPCRCLGSIRYVHNNCLLKWLEVSARRRSGPPCCELCQYQYLRHKKFVISHWRFPECSLRDKFLHFFFIVNVCLMIACAAVTIICFKEVEPERVPYRNANNYRPGELTLPELITVSCGILFFLAFFLAIYVEVKAKHTVYQLICKFFYMNHEWSVEEYDRKRDIAESRRKKEKESKKNKSRNNRRQQRRESSSRQASSVAS